MCNGHCVAMYFHAPCGIVFVFSMFVNVHANKKVLALKWYVCEQFRDQLYYPSSF